MMDVASVASALRARLIDLLRQGHRVEVDAVLNELDPNEDLDEEDRLNMLFGSERLISFDVVFDASPMSNTASAGINVLDLGGDVLFLVSPPDSGIDQPALALGTFLRGDRQQAYQLVGEVITKSSLENDLPAGGSLSDRIEVASDFPQDVLRTAFAKIFAARPRDVEDAKAVIGRAGGDASDSDGFVERYLEAVVRRDP